MKKKDEITEIKIFKTKIQKNPRKRKDYEDKITQKRFNKSIKNHYIKIICIFC